MMTLRYNDAEFLEAIKQRLIDKGWRKGKMGSPNGPNCIMGAAVLADPVEGVELVLSYPSYDSDSGYNLGRIIMDGRDADWDEVPQIIRLLRLTGFPDAASLYEWNDSSRQTLETLFEGIDAALEKLDA
jgi:hypothetical protein